VEEDVFEECALWVEDQEAPLQDEKAALAHHPLGGCGEVILAITAMVIDQSGLLAPIGSTWAQKHNTCSDRANREQGKGGGYQVPFLGVRPHHRQRLGRRDGYLLAATTTFAVGSILSLLCRRRRLVRYQPRRRCQKPASPM